MKEAGKFNFEENVPNRIHVKEHQLTDVCLVVKIESDGGVTSNNARIRPPLPPHSSAVFQ